MELIDLAAGLAVLAGALLQSAVGFGFSLVCAPLVFAATTPERAIGLLLVLGLEMNLLTLATEGRRPAPILRTATTVLAWSVPGTLAGIAILRSVDKTALQVALTIVVFISLALQRREVSTPAAPRWAAPVAGVAAGALNTSLSTSGPPLILLLRGRGVPAARIRDTLGICFLGLSVIGVAALAATGTFEAAPRPAALAAGIPIVALGHLAGRPLFTHLERRAYEPVLTAVLVASAVSGLLVALL